MSEQKITNETFHGLAFLFNPEAFEQMPGQMSMEAVESTLDDALRAALKRHGLPVSAPMMMWARMRLEQYALEQHNSERSV